MFDPINALKEYVSYPSVSTDPSFEAGMQGARDFVVRELKKLKFEVEVIPTAQHPIILASRKGKAGAPHVILYDHYDVQPADPYELWESKPFEAEVRGDRIYGRGAADNKGPLIVQLAALHKIYEQYPDFPLNITFLIEGEEEIGSPSFDAFLKAHKNRLMEADFILLSDTDLPDTETPMITTGLRGILGMEIRATAAKGDLHSGWYGGAVYNPIQALTEICASLHNKDGSVNVPGFYDDVAEALAWEREQLKLLPTTEKDLQDHLGVPAFYKQPGYTPMEATRYAPTLEFNGIGGGYQGEGDKTVIPSTAFAKITCRLVPNQDPVKIFNAVWQAIQDRAPEGVKITETHRKSFGAPYVVIPPHHADTPKDQSPALAKAFDQLEETILSVFNKKPLYLRNGGSIPIIQDIKAVTGLDSIMLGLYTPQDGLHAPNESFNLVMLEKGIRIYEKFLCGLVDL